MELEAVILLLMGSHQGSELVCLQECLKHSPAKQDRDATIVWLLAVIECLFHLHGVGPEEVIEEVFFVAWLLESLDLVNAFEALQAG